MVVPTKPQKQPTTVQSVDRALDLLEELATAREGLTLGDLSARAGLNPSTCHHLLSTMLQRNYVIQDPKSRRYLLGNQLLHLSAARTQQIELVPLAMPALQELNRQTGEAVHLATLEGTDLITLAKLESMHAVKVDNGMIGKSNASHATATGKALLAHLAPSELDAVIRTKGLQRFTVHTITDLDRLQAELQKVREQGFSVDDQEFQPGVYCVGAPVLDYTGKVVASVSCSTPTMRITEQILPRIIRLVLQAAGQVSGQLGAGGTPAAQ